MTERQTLCTIVLLMAGALTAMMSIRLVDARHQARGLYGQTQK